MPAASFSVGTEIQIPVNLLAETNSLGLGISFKTVTPVASFAEITCSGGIIQHFGKEVYGKDVTRFTNFPLKAGVRLISEYGLYAEPQAGFNIVHSFLGNEGSFIYAFNAGSIIGKHVDIAAFYESMLKDGISLSGMGFRIAYVF